MAIITDLPEDILTTIFPFLDAGSFLGLIRTCRALYQYRQDPAYWRNITSSTFRLPVSPLLKADGARWYWLYKRLRTQTRLYTWGQGIEGCLGPGLSRTPPPHHRSPFLHRLQHRMRPNPAFTYERTNSCWPTEVRVPDEVGIIADLQCGGWSTSILSSTGKLYTVGLINGVNRLYVGDSVARFERLQYLTQSTSAIRQFSSGRCHILALTDDGEILSWDRINAKGLKAFSRRGRDFGGKAVRVVAGWGESSAYIPETGIVYWKPIENDQQDDMLDGLHVYEKIIRGTARRHVGDDQYLEVVTHVALESWIVWLTSEGKLFACDLQADSSSLDHPRYYPFEVPGYTSSARVLKDVQGQYNKFVVFTETGEVLAGNTYYLRVCGESARSHPSRDDPDIPAPPEEWSRLDQLTGFRPPDVPALQHQQVVSVAFGDHHYHALHLNGKITSYGTESQSCGSLGLGDMPGGGRFRGLTARVGWQPDVKLLPQAERLGRQIWFEPEKRDWLKYMEQCVVSGALGLVSNERGETRPADALWHPNTHKPFLFSQWVEQEGRHWQDGPLNGDDVSGNTSGATLHEEDFHLDSYFALTVSALGWHSGALVLVDEEKAEAIRQKWVAKFSDEKDQEKGEPSHVMPGHFEDDSTEPEESYVWQHEGFPTVRLPLGYVMPGVGEPRRWRDGIPEWSELGLSAVD